MSIRIKNNSLSINDKEYINKKIIIPNNVRVITYKDDIIINKKNKNNNNVKLKQTIICNVITNLSS